MNAKKSRSALSLGSADWLPGHTGGFDAGAVDAARRRLLQAAATCFAGKGYSATTVRDITARAECNVGAVTYHFGGKHKAYIAVFEERLSELTAYRLQALQALHVPVAPSLEQVIETFAVAFLDPVRGDQRGRETMMLLLRELVDCQLPANVVEQRMIRPTVGALAQALQRACPGIEPERLTQCCHSLVSQLVHVLQVQRFHDRGFAADRPCVELAQTVRHIVQFSAAGVRGCRAGGCS